MFASQLKTSKKMTKLILKGAIYTNGDCLLRPHFTGKNSPCLEYEGVKYYESEYSPYHTEDMELLSDISNKSFHDYNTNF